ncbi:hypothetical protein Baya_1010 [Bagarius yarrelli]|uniref:Uncharacterized protein n=1 Tax=Bagarius yarrelli TaxID=175774 RepID=A0A556TJX4_BAGYA|nr:hypothetical protein Baya_1010 [Bagarius yarrelli]
MLLEQGGKSLEEFLELVHFTTFPDYYLCTTYFEGLNATSKARLSGEYSYSDFVAYVEWVLACNGSPFTLGPVEENPSSTTPSSIREVSVTVSSHSFLAFTATLVV